MAKNTTDPLELMVARTLDECSIGYRCPDQEKWGVFGSRLDFYIPLWDIYIECKAWGTPRIHPQVENVNNCIILTGLAATARFCDLVRRAHANN